MTSTEAKVVTARNWKKLWGEDMEDKELMKLKREEFREELLVSNKKKKVSKKTHK